MICLMQPVRVTCLILLLFCCNLAFLLGPRKGLCESSYFLMQCQSKLGAQTCPTNRYSWMGLRMQQDDVVTTSKPRMRKLPLPYFNSPLGIQEGWVSKNGCYIKYPPENTKVIGVIHFIGGAFAGAAPQVLYRFFLENLSLYGYVVVATPFSMQLDYLKLCDEVVNKFDSVAVELAKEVGAVPVIGVGHSLGAVLQVLITSLFPDTPRGANVLISYNNKNIYDAIPLWKELVLPLSRELVREREANSPLLRRLDALRRDVEGLVGSWAASPLSPLFVEEEVLPLLLQSREVVAQLPVVLEEIGRFTEANVQSASRRSSRTLPPLPDFSPSPTSIEEACRRMYRARRTLVLSFTADSLDESGVEEAAGTSEDSSKKGGIVATLREANTIMRMKRPLVEMEVQGMRLGGNHLTPLLQAPMAPPSPLVRRSVGEAVKYLNKKATMLDTPSEAKNASLNANLAEVVASFIKGGG